MTTQKRQKNSEDEAVTEKYYLSNSSLLPEVIASREKGVISNKLAGMLMMLATRYSTRPNFVNYSFREDMISEALVDLSKNALKFNPEKSNNPFAFYTTCIHHSFIGYLNSERKQRRIRDQMLVDLGENPSFGFQDEYRANMNDESIKNSMDELRGDISEARERLQKEHERELEKKREEATAAGLLTFDEPEPVISHSSNALEDVDALSSSMSSDDLEVSTPLLNDQDE